MAFRNYDAALQAYTDVPELKAHVLATERAKILEQMGYGGGKPVPEDQIELVGAMLQARMTVLGKSPDEFVAAVNNADAIEQAAITARLAGFNASRAAAPAASQAEETQTVHTFDKQDRSGPMDRIFQKVTATRLGRTAVLGAAGMGMFLGGADNAMAQDKKGKDRTAQTQDRGTTRRDGSSVSVRNSTISQTEAEAKHTAAMDKLREMTDEHDQFILKALDKAKQNGTTKGEIWRDIVIGTVGSGGSYSSVRNTQEYKQVMQDLGPNLARASEARLRSIEKQEAVVDYWSPQAVEDRARRGEVEKIDDRGRQAQVDIMTQNAETMKTLNDNLKKALEAGDMEKAKAITGMIKDMNGATANMRIEAPDNAVRNNELPQQVPILTGSDAQACINAYNNAVVPKVEAGRTRTKQDHLAAAKAAAPSLGASCIATVDGVLANSNDRWGNGFRAGDLNNATRGGGGPRR